MLRHLPTPGDPHLLVGIETFDDAGIYQLSDDLALVQTVDFFTPIVDNPYMYGAIAVANALSDVYAMGGRPITALNLLAYPVATLEPEIVAEILRGGGDKLREAGVALLGGHTIDDPEPKFGVAVTGTIHPDRIISNATGRADDLLILTKPLGTGIIATTLKADEAPEPVALAAMESMARLNDAASTAMIEVGVHAATDVTGFGLLGHLGEMAAGSGVGAEIQAGAVPILPGALELLTRGFVPGGTRRNLAQLAARVTFAPGLPAGTDLLLADAQTSGGLLIAVAPERADALLRALRARAVGAALIGRLTAGPSGAIIVLA